MKLTLNNFLHFISALFTKEHIGAELLTSLHSKHYRAVVYTTQAIHTSKDGYTAISVKPFGQPMTPHKILIYIDEDDADIKIAFKDFAGRNLIFTLDALDIINNVANPPPETDRPVE